MTPPGDHWRDTVPSVNDYSRTAPLPAPSGVAGMRRNHWLVCVGIRKLQWTSQFALSSQRASLPGLAGVPVSELPTGLPRGQARVSVPSTVRHCGATARLTQVRNGDTGYARGHLVELVRLVEIAPPQVQHAVGRNREDHGLVPSIAHVHARQYDGPDL